LDSDGDEDYVDDEDEVDGDSLGGEDDSMPVDQDGFEPFLMDPETIQIAESGIRDMSASRHQAPALVVQCERIAQRSSEESLSKELGTPFGEHCLAAAAKLEASRLSTLVQSLSSSGTSSNSSAHSVLQQMAQAMKQATVLSNAVRLMHTIDAVHEVLRACLVCEEAIAAAIESPSEFVDDMGIETSESSAVERLHELTVCICLEAQLAATIVSVRLGSCMDPSFWTSNGLLQSPDGAATLSGIMSIASLRSRLAWSLLRHLSELNRFSALDVQDIDNSIGSFPLLGAANGEILLPLLARAFSSECLSLPSHLPPPSVSGKGALRPSMQWDVVSTKMCMNMALHSTGGLHGTENNSSKFQGGALPLMHLVATELEKRSAEWTLRQWVAYGARVPHDHSLHSSRLQRALEFELQANSAGAAAMMHQDRINRVAGGCRVLVSSMSQCWELTDDAIALLAREIRAFASQFSPATNGKAHGSIISQWTMAFNHWDKSLAAGMLKPFAIDATDRLPNGVALERVLGRENRAMFFAWLQGVSAQLLACLKAAHSDAVRRSKVLFGLRLDFAGSKPPDALPVLVKGNITAGVRNFIVRRNKIRPNRSSEFSSHYASRHSAICQRLGYSRRVVLSRAAQDIAMIRLIACSSALSLADKSDSRCLWPGAVQLCTDAFVTAVECAPLD